MTDTDMQALDKALRERDCLWAKEIAQAFSADDPARRLVEPLREMTENLQRIRDLFKQREEYWEQVANDWKAEAMHLQKHRPRIAEVREMLMEMGATVLLILEPDFPKREIADHSSYHVDAILKEHGYEEKQND